MLNAPINEWPLVFWLFFGLYIGISLVELFFAFFEMSLPRKIIKPFCVGILSIGALILSPDWMGFLIFLGATLGAIGDIFLMFKGRKSFFVIGSVFFLLGHICYISTMIWLFFPVLKWYHFMIMAILQVIVWWLSVYPVQKLVKKYSMSIPGCFYLSTLFMDLVWGFFLAGLATGRMIPVGLGAVFFLASDIYLVKCNFWKHSKREDFFIMLLYLLGQGFIVFGLLFSKGMIFA